MSSANCVSNARRGKTVANTITTWGHVTAGLFFSPQAHAHHQEVRQNDQRPMMRPSGPTPYCIIAHPQPWLAVFKARCDGPTHAAHVHQFFQCDVNGSVAQGGLPLPCRALPTPHPPDLGTGQGVPHSDHPQGGTLRHHGPLAAFFAGLACPRLGGQRRRTSNTVRALGAPSTRRSRCGRRPRPRLGGMGVAGRSSHTRVLWGTSTPYHQPRPATPSRKPGLPPPASSAPTHRHRSAWLWTTVASISWANAGLVVHVVSAGRPPGRRRAAYASSVSHSAGTDNRRSSTVEPWALTEPPNTPAWQLAHLPSSPPYCRFTPTAWPPGFGTSLPSTISTPSAAPRSVSTSFPCWCNSRSSCHCPALIKDCMARTALGATPSTASTIGSIDLRGNVASTPGREECAASRGSRRGNNGL